MRSEDCREVRNDDGTTRKALHSYEALSYVWGCTKVTRRILCDDRVLHVTQNLYAALDRLRYPGRKRTLWIDAVCIDQTSKEERNHQVRKMAEIYTDAKGVVVWLGDSSKGDPFFDFQRGLYVLNLTRSKPLKRSSWASNRFDSEAVPVDWEAFLGFFKSAWFGRKWVIQEVAFVQNATLYKGWSSFELILDGSYAEAVGKANEFDLAEATNGPSLASLMEATARHRELAVQFDNFLTIVQIRATEAENSGWALSTVLSRTSASASTLFHDRIFAILSLVQGLTTSQLEYLIDYDLGRGQLITRTTKMIIQQTQLQHLIHAIGDGISWQAVGVNRTENVPSWIPWYLGRTRWRNRELRHGVQRAKSGKKDLLQTPHIVDNQYLKVYGKRVGCVLETSANVDQFTYSRFFSRLRTWRSLVQRPHLRSKEDCWRQFWDLMTLCHDARVRFNGARSISLLKYTISDLLYMKPEHLTDFSNGKVCDMTSSTAPSVPNRDLKASSDDETDLIAGYQALKQEPQYVPQDWLMRSVWSLVLDSDGYQLAWTEDGMLGLITSLAKPGDLIFVCESCPAPLVLRQKTAGHFAVVGGACFTELTGVGSKREDGIPTELVSIL